jgi:transposase
MPDPWTLRRVESGGACAVMFGPRVLFRYDPDDIGMRNLAVVALTDADVSGQDAAALFGLSPVYVSMLRGRARESGAAGLVRRRGRPPKLGDRQVRQARVWAGEGMSQTEIAGRLKVARSVISELLGRLGPIPPQPELVQPVEPRRAEEPGDFDDVAGAPDADAGEADAEDAQAKDADAGLAETGEAAAAANAPTANAPAANAPAADAPVAWPAARIGEGVFWSRHAGAMLAHAFTDRVGATAVLGGAAGAAGAARFDDVGLLAATSMAFTLGAKTVEQVKHLTAGEAGPLCGLARLPDLRTLRPRLAGIADATDPLGLQRAFAKAMLDADPCESGVYFVDDHFVPYAGAKPVPKGWNTKRRTAQRGRADTWVTDHAGRAVAFTTGEPSGLTKTLPPVLAELREIVGPHAKICSGSTAAGPTRRCLPPAGTPTRTGSPTAAARWPSRPACPCSLPSSATADRPASPGARRPSTSTATARPGRSPYSSAASRSCRSSPPTCSPVRPGCSPTSRPGGGSRTPSNTPTTTASTPSATTSPTSRPTPARSTTPPARPPTPQSNPPMPRSATPNAPWPNSSPTRP